jgi:hypothetical protein
MTYTARGQLSDTGERERHGAAHSRHGGDAKDVETRVHCATEKQTLTRNAILYKDLEEVQIRAYPEASFTVPIAFTITA